jgi:hypothetical protein
MTQVAGLKGVLLGILDIIHAGCAFYYRSSSFRLDFK